MPPHQRHIPPGSQMSYTGTGSGNQAQQGAYATRVNSDITALNSSILLISQKIKYLVRNEKILGRNLLVVNKKLKDVQESRLPGGGSASAGFEGSLSSISTKLDEMQQRLVSLESEVENIRQNYAKAEQLSEMRYVINAINPLEFATLKDVQDMVSGKPARGKK